MAQTPKLINEKIDQVTSLRLQSVCVERRGKEFVETRYWEE